MAKWPYNTNQWQALRITKLSSDPLCHACSLRGALTPAKAVDHIKPISAGGAPFPPLDQLMSLCIDCHNFKTGSHDSPRVQSNGFQRRFKGCAKDGSPIDPLDPWHGGYKKTGKVEAIDRPPSPDRVSFL